MSAALNRDAERELFHRFRAGGADADLARDEIIAANLGLVISMARRHRLQGLPTDDLIQEGTLGLMQGVDRFDPDRGFRFSTYATHWIRQAMVRATLNKGRTVRVPVNRMECVNRARRARQQLYQTLGRNPTPAEIGAAIDVTAAQAEELLSLAAPLSSLDAPAGEDGEHTVGELLVDDDAQATDEWTDERDLRDAIERALVVLDRRERAVITLRFGLGTEEAMTLEQIGQRVGRTRERIRQIQLRALAKLRRSRRATELQLFLAA